MLIGIIHRVNRAQGLNLDSLPQRGSKFTGSWQGCWGGKAGPWMGVFRGAAGEGMGSRTGAPCPHLQAY